MLKRWLIPIASLVLVGLLLVPKVFLMPQLEASLQRELVAAFQTDKVQVQLEAPWGIEPLLGRIPHLLVVAENSDFEGIKVALVEIQGDDVRLDRPALWSKKEFVYEGATFLEANITILEGDLNNYFWGHVDPERNLRIEVTQEGIGLKGVLAFWGMEWDIRLQGLLEVVQGTSVRFVPQNIEFQETRVPPFLLEVFSDTYDFTIELAELPYPLEITAIQFANQQIMFKMGVVQ